MIYETLKKSLVYLATPYTKFLGGINLAHADACSIAGALLKNDGIMTYSPIAHCHPIAIFGEIDPLDSQMWVTLQERMMERMDALLVAKMIGWEESSGVKHEIAFFKKSNKPIFYLCPMLWEFSE